MRGNEGNETGQRTTAENECSGAKENCGSPTSTVGQGTSSKEINSHKFEQRRTGIVLNYIRNHPEDAHLSTVNRSWLLCRMARLYDPSARTTSPPLLFFLAPLMC